MSTTDIPPATKPREGLGGGDSTASGFQPPEAVVGGRVALTFGLYGTPIPQGSHRSYVVGNRAVTTDDNENTKPYRAEVTHAALITKRLSVAADEILLPSGAVAVVAIFYMPRPQGHYGTGRNAGQLRPSAPRWPTTKKADTDKLGRLIGDALTAAGVWRDDCQVIHWQMTKLYATGTPSAHITVYDLEGS